MTRLSLRRAPAGWGILTPFPSATALALALGDRLTLRGLTMRRNPWTFGARVSHPRLRYSCQHSHFRYLQHASRLTFTGLRNAPLPRRRTEDGRQTTDKQPRWLQTLLARLCSIRVITWYSSRQLCQVGSSI